MPSPWPWQCLHLAFNTNVALSSSPYPSRLHKHHVHRWSWWWWWNSHWHCGILKTMCLQSYLDNAIYLGNGENAVILNVTNPSRSRFVLLYQKHLLVTRCPCHGPWQCPHLALITNIWRSSSPCRCRWHTYIHSMRMGDGDEKPIASMASQRPYLFSPILITHHA